MKVLRDEIKDLTPPAEILHAMQQITAEAIRKIAAAIEQPGGAQAVQLKVAEKAVDAYAQLAQKNNTMIVPGHMGEVAGLIGTAMTLMRADSAGSAAAPQSSSAASRPGNSTSV